MVRFSDFATGANKSQAVSGTSHLTSTSDYIPTSGRQSQAPDYIPDTCSLTQQQSLAERYHSSSNSDSSRDAVKRDAHSNSTPPPQLQQPSAQSALSGMVTRSTRRANRQQHLQQQPAPQPPPFGSGAGAVPVVPGALLAPMPSGGLLSGRASPSTSASAAAVGRVSIAPISVLDRLNDNCKAQSSSSGFLHVLILNF